MKQKFAYALLPVLCVAALVGCPGRKPDVAVSNGGGAPEGKGDAPPAPRKSEVVDAPLAWEFEYDGDQLAGASDPAGRKTRFVTTRDKGGRVTQVERLLTDGDRVTKVTFEFDEFGRRVRMTDGAGTVRYKYDDFGHLAEVKRDDGPALTYVHDTRGRVTSLSVGGLTVSYEYDFLGRLAHVDTPAGRVEYQYNTGDGLVIRKLPNGVRTVWQYGVEGRLQAIEHSSEGKLLAKFDYEYRPDGLIARVKEWSPEGEKTVDYRYDKVQRLTEVDDSRFGKTTYAYDLYGNRTETATEDKDGHKETVTTTYDWAGRLLTHDGRPCRHDPSGNLLEYSRKDGAVTLAYAAANQLATVETSREKVHYDYDGEGNLVGRAVEGRKTVFVPDPTADVWRPLLTVQPDGRQALVLWDGDTPLGVVDGGETRFFLHNHLGSVRCEVDGRGKPAGWFNYCPFGTPQGGPQAGRLRPGFAGLFYDSAAGVYLTRARAYDPILGRFCQTDPQHRIPLGSQKDLSLYAYCGADPVNFEDATGNQPGFVPPPPPPPPLFNQRPLAPPLPRMNLAPQQPAVFPHFTWGTRTGEASAQYWADRYVRTGNYLYAGPGLLASLWTPETYKNTAFFLTLPVTGETAFLRGVGIAGKAFGTADGVQSLFTRGERLQGAWDVAANLIIPGGKYAAETAQASAAFRGSRFVQLAVAQTRGMDAAMNTIELGKNIYEVKNRGDRATLGNLNLNPTKVGGVALRGSGGLIKDLGPLQGVALDANGRLVLLGKDDATVKLPPLRLDDIVTVFRYVYREGEGPYVSIDPEKQGGESMRVRLGPGLEKSYVGWVLFEADRFMKTLTLGSDNVTNKEIDADLRADLKKKDYKSLFDLGAAPPAAGKEQVWERFWIVPAEVVRRQSPKGELTLLDVPLKLDVAAEWLRGGKFVAAPGKASKEALAFTKWFSENYDFLARECRSLPPEGSGMKEAVPIFEELRRLTLVVAVAERLREQGVPLPAWIRDHVVADFPVPEATPGRTFTRGRLAIYGGVTLGTPKEGARTVVDEAAAKLTPAVRQAVAAAPSFTPVTVRDGGTTYRAVALPGGDTTDFGACRLEEADLTVPLDGADPITLVRSFHSFFRPADPTFGGAWALDLPRLEPVRRAEVAGDKKIVHNGYQLCSPFDTYAETFTRLAAVPEQGGAQLFVPTTSQEFLGIGGGTLDGEKVVLLLFRDGRRWYFDPEGRLVAADEAGRRVSYRRDAKGRVSRIEGLYGKKRASIELTYGPDGRLAAAAGSDKVRVNYVYGPEGRLRSVERAGGRVGYEYDDGLVKRVLGGERLDRVEREFRYAEGGRLKGESGGGRDVTYQVKDGEDGSRRVVALVGEGGLPERAGESAEYDARRRPLRRRLADGTDLSWDYRADGGSEITVRVPGEPSVTVSRSAKGDAETWRLPGVAACEARYDPAGRLTRLEQGGRTLVRREWHPNGLLAREQHEGVEVRPQYQDGSALSGVYLTAPGEGPAMKRWVKVEVDDDGRVTGVTDSSKGKLSVSYDGAGRPARIDTGRGRVDVERDDAGRPVKVTSSWGTSEENAYDPKDGSLTRTEVRAGAARSSVEREGGLVKGVTGFDGGRFGFTYDGPGPGGRELRTVHTPNGLTLGYTSDPAGRTAAVSCGAFRFEYHFDEKGRLLRLAQVPIRE